MLKGPGEPLNSTGAVRTAVHFGSAELSMFVRVRTTVRFVLPLMAPRVVGCGLQVAIRFARIRVIREN